MATLKETRTRIASVKKTRQVTSAMKMVSAAKLKKAQGIFNKFLSFAEMKYRILQNLAQGLDEKDLSIFFKQPVELKRVLIVSISSNRGLCGAFNANLINKTQARISSYKKKGIDVAIFTVGKKINQALQKTENIIFQDSDIQENLSYNGVVNIANKIMKEFVGKKYDKIEIIYNHAKSASVQEVLFEDYLPVPPIKTDEKIQNVGYIFEPNKEQILEQLVPQMLRTQLYKILLDSSVSEHAARMISMNKATDNAGDLLRDLNLEYNKARQATITSEILEIVSGAEALKNG